MNKTFGAFIEKNLRFIFQKIFNLPLSQEKVDVCVQFVKFGIIGLSNTFISYVVYIVTLLGLHKIEFAPSIDYLIAQFVGFILSVLWSFYWNNKFVFQNRREKGNWIHTLLKTYFSYAFTGLFLNSILSMIWVGLFNWSKLIAPAINLLVSVPLNFILNKFWTFKDNFH